MINRDRAYRFYMADMARVCAMDIRGRDGIPLLWYLMRQDDFKNDDPDAIIDRISNGINNM